MAQEVTMYQAYDGTLFVDEKSCKLFELKLQDNEKIDSFLESSHNIYTKPAHRTVAETTLYEFCAYVRGDDMKKAIKKEDTHGTDSD